MEDRKTHAPEDVRQGDIVLRRRASRGVFIAALAGFVILILGLGVALAL